MKMIFLIIMTQISISFYSMAHADPKPPSPNSPSTDTLYNQNVVDILSQAPSFKFIWGNLKQPNGVIVKRAEIIVAAHLVDSNQHLKFQHLLFQLDTGAATSLLYEIPAREQLPKVIFETSNKLPSSLALQFDGSFQDVVTFEPRNNYGQHSDESHKPSDGFPIVGTLGMDFFSIANEGFALDYRKQQIYSLSRKLLDVLLTQYPDNFVRYQEAYQGRILLPFSIGDTDELAMFDTGSSQTELSVPPSRWEKITGLNTNDSAVKQIHGLAWGKPLTIFAAKVDKNIYISGQFKQLNKIETPFPYPHDDKFPAIIGNALFIDDVIVVDIANKKFGLFQGSAK